jgi:hypothetical protein
MEGTPEEVMDMQLWTRRRLVVGFFSDYFSSLRSLLGNTCTEEDWGGFACFEAHLARIGNFKVQ